MLGPDDIHARVLKELKYEAADLLTKIYNLSFRSDGTPVDWIVANVTAIFKREAGGSWKLVSCFWAN